MKPMFTGILIGVVSGMILGLLIAFFIAPSLMFREDKNSSDFDVTVARLEKAIEVRGWKTPVIHDLQATAFCPTRFPSDPSSACESGLLEKVKLGWVLRRRCRSAGH